MPAAVREMPSPSRPVPIVSNAIAMTGTRTPHGWTDKAIWFSWIIVPQFAPFGSGARPRNASAAIRPIE